MPDDTKRARARQRIAEKRAAEAAARARAASRRRAVTGGVVTAVVVAVAVIVTVVVQTRRTTTAADAPTPAHTEDDGRVIAVGSSTAPVTVDVYEDFQCPVCRDFEQRSGDTLAQLVATGEVQLRYHGMAFIDTAANDQYSTRALNAAGAVVDAAGPDVFQEFHDLLYANQPPEGGTGLTDAQLISYAHRAGATGTRVERDIQDLTFGDWVREITDQASGDGVTQTPTVVVDGHRLDDLSPSGITSAVQAAAA